MLREQNAELRREISRRFGGPDVTEILKKQNAELMKDIAARISGPSFNEILKKQNAELMKDIAARLNGPRISEALRREATRPEIPSGTNGAESPRSRESEPGVKEDPSADGSESSPSCGETRHLPSH